MKKYVRVLCSVVLVGALAWRLEWRKVGEAFANLNLGLWFLAVAVYIAVQIVSSVRWRMLGRVQGYDAPMGAYIAYYYIGMLFNLVLPTGVGGDVVRVWYLANRDGTGPREGRRMTALVTVMAERINGIIVLILLACVAVIFSPIALPQWISGTVAAVGAAAIAGILAVPFFGLMFRKYPHLGLHPWLAPVRRFLFGSLAYRGHPGMLFVVTGLSAFVQLGNVVAWWLVGEGLGIQVSPWYYGVMVPLVSLVATFVPTIGGIGAREMATAVLLVPMQVAEDKAVTLSVLFWLATVLCSLGGLFPYLFGHFPRYQPQQTAAAIEEEEVTAPEPVEERRLAS